MKRVFSLCFVCALAVMAYAVPARRGWHAYTQSDGTTVELQLFGDEYYHYYVNREGQEVREINGMYKVVGEAPAPEVAKARRARGVARRQRKDVGTTPNLAPKGVVILVNFSNKSMQSEHTNATFDELCNSANCTVNSGYPSAREYFKSQSNGAYAPQFDVFGPVTLSRNVAYYGTDKPRSDEGDDQHATDAVVEGCILANQQFSIHWSDYDSDNDGKVDFVYVIYAGQGQADGGSSETIWPHNWTVSEARSNGYCTYKASECKVGGKTLDNYAMSGEISGSALGGIGTLCHEFGHVMGMPDFYDTSYGTNYKNCLTPNDWDVMDGGAYNGDGHCPPNYSPWEKDFFGWHTPINLGNEGQNLTLYANGTENYQAYQITSSGSYVGPTTSGERYYIENRQAQGWDAPLAGHGMLIWKVNFNASKWTNNEPNNTANNPYYTIISASGSKIGWDGSNDNCPKNTFPGSAKVTSYSDISGKPLLNIKETNNIVTLTYIEEPATDPFDVTWMSNGALWATTQCTDKVVLPDSPEACEDGKVFVGWCSQKDYNHATTAPTFVNAGDAVAEGATFYAVFAVKGEGTGTVEDKLTNTTTGVSGTTYTEWSGKSVNSSAVFAGNSAGGYSSIQLSQDKQAGVVTTASGGKVAKITVEWNSNTAAGRTLDIYGKNTPYTASYNMYGGINTDEATKGTKLGSIVYGTSTEFIVSGDYTYIGVRPNTGALYLASLTITWGGAVSYTSYSTACGGGTDIQSVTSDRPAAVKTVRNGQLLIMRGDELYTVTGARLK